MSFSRNAGLLGLVAATVSLSACLSTPGAQDAFQVGQKTVEAAGVKQTASLRFVITDDSAAKAALEKKGYHVAYIQNTEWSEAKFYLDKIQLDTDSASPTYNTYIQVPGSETSTTVNATVTPSTLIRSASASFTSLTPGSGYRVRVELYKLDADGTTKLKIATGVHDGTDNGTGSGFNLVSGANTKNIVVTLTDTDGKVEVTFPAAGSAATTGSLVSNVSSGSSYSVQRVAGAASQVSAGTFATGTNWTTAVLNQATGMDMDPNGNLYVAAASRIVKLPADTTTAPTVIGGTGTPGYNGPGATSPTTSNLATDNLISDPRGVAAMGGYVYFCDRANNLVRAIELSTGIITNLAGKVGTAGATPSATAQVGTDCTLSSPTGLVVDSAGNLYFCEMGAGRIDKLTPDGQLSTFITGLTNPDALEIDRTNNRLWFSSGTTVYVVTGINATPSTPVSVGAIPAPSGAAADALSSVGGLAYDYNNTLYVATNGMLNNNFEGTNTTYVYPSKYTRQVGDYNNFLYRVPLGTDGKLRTTFSMERIGGAAGVYCGYRSAEPTYTSTPLKDYRDNGAVSTTPVTNAITQGMVGCTTDGLVIDMRNSSSTGTLSGYLYKSNTNPNSSSTQIIKFSANSL